MAGQQSGSKATPVRKSASAQLQDGRQALAHPAVGQGTVGSQKDARTRPSGSAVSQPTSSSSSSKPKPNPTSAVRATHAQARSPLGGDVTNAWSSDDLDRLLGKRLAVPAASFYDLRNGAIDKMSLASQLLSAVPCCFIIHVRYHWVAARLSRSSGQLVLTIYDSAPSIPVRRDVRLMAQSLGLPDPQFAPCPRQARGTSECGVFAALYVLILASGDTPPAKTNTVSLAELRTLSDAKVFHERGRLLLGMPHRSHQPYAPPPAPEGQGPATVHEVVTVDDTPDEHHDLTNLKMRADRTRQALVPHTQLYTETVDSLLAAARAEPGAADLHLYAAPTRKLRSKLRFPFLKPLIYAGHFSLLYMRNASFGTVYDTLPRHHAAQRDQTIDEFLRSGGVDRTARNVRLKVIGPQECNDCGLWVVNQARRLLHVPFWDATTGVTLREWLVRPLLDSLQQHILALTGPEPTSAVAPTQLSGTQLPSPACPSPLDTSASQGVSHRELLTVLRTARPGQRISVTWWEPSLPAFLVTWTGTVTSALDSSLGTIMVQWDKDLEQFSGDHLRPRCFPEFGFPDPRFAFALPLLSGRPSRGVRRTTGPSLDELRKALQSDPPEYDSDVSDSDSDVDEVADVTMLSRLDDPDPAPSDDPFTAEREPIVAPLCSAERLCARDARSWFIHNGRPAHIPPVAWRQLSAATRSSHIRWLRALKGADPSLYGTPLATAVVEIVLQRARQSGWKWSTISSNLSLASSALAKLPLYSNCTQGIDISSDPVFSAASRRSSQLARITVKQNTRLTAPMSLATYQKVLDALVDPADRLFFEICWTLAARIGDARQLTSANITFDHAQATAEALPVTFRFVSGKTTQAHGPYSVRVVLSRTLAQRLTDHMKHTGPHSSLWTAASQERLRVAVRAHNLTLRSVRKGSLQHQAALGVSDEALRLLSGHRRMETLHRYLNWGEYSANAAKAALERHTATVRGGASEDPRPPLMGLHSGEIGPAGRRFASPPAYIPLRTPSSADLGLDQDVDTSDWPLHVRPGLCTLDWEALLRIAPESCVAMLTHARRWVSDPTLYGTPKTSYAATKLTDSQLQTLVDVGKLEPLAAGDARAFCSGWLLPQFNKRRLRPIFEPSINKTLLSNELLAQVYPSRLERRQQMVGAETFVELDFAAFFDQIELAPEVRPYFTVVRRGSRYALTRLPMGASFAPGVAQAVTWSLVAATQQLHPNVQFATMIDNVRISGGRADVAAAAQFFIKLCQDARVTLNEVDIEAQLRANSGVFLGELYTKAPQHNQWYIQNSERTVDKIRAAAALWRQRPVPGSLTRRNFAAFAGLLLFAAHTLSIPLAHHFELLRGYSAIVAGNSPPDAPSTARDFWDQPLPYLEPSLQGHLMALADELIANRAQLITPQAAAPLDEAYDTVVYIDASQNAWAAIVVDQVGTPQSTTTLLQQRWRDTLRYSAWAEPRAVERCLTHLSQRQNPPKRIAVVTDHIAIVSGQSRWTSRFAGFSASWFLNSAYKSATQFDRVEFFYIKGAENPADAASREVSAGFDLAAKPLQPLALPALSSLYHPHADTPVHPFEHQPATAQGRPRRAQWGKQQDLQDGDCRHFIKKQTTNSRLCFEHQMRMV